MNDKLKSLLNEADTKFGCFNAFCTERATEEAKNNLLNYLSENSVIVLPCKVGDVVYTNINGIGLQNSFRVNSVDLLGFSNGLYSWTWHQLGKSVFLTLEDAQNALKD